MCRSTDYHGFQSNDGEQLKIRSFFVCFSGLKSRFPLPESVTLLYLPRINETSSLEIDGSKVRPDLPGFVTLHRVVSSSEKDVVFGSRERVRVGEGVRFEMYLGDGKVIKGIFRTDEGLLWKLECKCALENEMVGVEVSSAEVYVDAVGHVALSEMVAMVVKRKRHHHRGFDTLEEIPEEREMVDAEFDGCSCSRGEPGSISDGEDLEEDEEENATELDVEVEGLRWAVDVGIWVMCLGVGYFVSKASARKILRRRRRML